MTETSLKILRDVKEEFNRCKFDWNPSSGKVFIFYMSKHGKHLYDDKWINSDIVSELIQANKLKCEGEYFHQEEKCIRYCFREHSYPYKFYRSIPKEVKKLVMDRDNNSCVKCSASYKLEFDHIFPWSLGGWTEPNNLQILCSKCNAAKSNKIAI